MDKVDKVDDVDIKPGIYAALEGRSTAQPNSFEFFHQPVGIPAMNVCIMASDSRKTG